MKKIILMLIFSIMPLFVYADEILLSCPNAVDINSEFVCSITGKTNGVVTAVSTKINSNDFTFVSFDSASDWLGDGLNGQIDLYTADDLEGTFDIGTVKFKSNSNSSTVILDSVVFYDINGKSVKVDTVKKNVNIKNKEDNSNSNNIENNTGNSNNTTTNNNVSGNKNELNNMNDKVDDDINEDNVSENVTNDSQHEIVNNYISDIVIEGYDLKFKSDIYEYTLEIGDEEKLEIVPYLEYCGDCSFIIRNNKDLVDGSVIEIEMLLNEIDSVIYRINIKKRENDFTFVFVCIIAILVIINIVRTIMSLKKKR